jgi:hypothetical protein
MTIQVTISSIVGTSPYDLYVCQVDGTDCFYIDRLTSEQLPYVFDIPAPYNNSESYLFKVVDDYGSISTGTTYLYASPTPTATVTPTITPTPTITATVTITPTPSLSQTPGASPSPTSTQTPTNTPTNSQTPTPSVSETPGASPSPTSTQTPTNTETPTQTPTVTQLYYYYNLLNCNLANNSVGRSTEPLTGVTYNVDVNLCYTIVGIDLGPLYDYDLDVATLVTDCSDVLCGLPTPTLTPTITETPTPTITETPTNTPSNTPTETPTNTPTNNPSQTPTTTETPTNTPSNTPTETPTNTPTNNPSPTPTVTTTQTPTSSVVSYGLNLPSSTNTFGNFSSNLDAACNSLICLSAASCIWNSGEFLYTSKPNYNSLEVGDTFYTNSSLSTVATTLNGYRILFTTPNFSLVNFSSGVIESFVTCASPTPTSTMTPTPTLTPTPTKTTTPTVTPTISSTPPITPSPTNAFTPSCVNVVSFRDSSGGTNVNNPGWMELPGIFPIGTSVSSLRFNNTDWTGNNVWNILTDLSINDTVLIEATGPFAGTFILFKVDTEPYFTGFHWAIDFVTALNTNTSNRGPFSFLPSNVTITINSLCPTPTPTVTPTSTPI